MLWRSGVCLVVDCDCFAGFGVFSSFSGVMCFGLWFDVLMSLP